MTMTLTFSCTANFGEEAGVDQDSLTEEVIENLILNHYDVENVIRTDNDQGVDCDLITDITNLIVQVDDMSSTSCVEYTVYADVVVEEEEESESEEW